MSKPQEWPSVLAVFLYSEYVGSFGMETENWGLDLTLRRISSPEHCTPALRARLDATHLLPPSLLTITTSFPCPLRLLLLLEPSPPSPQMRCISFSLSSSRIRPTVVESPSFEPVELFTKAAAGVHLYRSVYAKSLTSWKLLFGIEGVGLLTEEGGRDVGKYVRELKLGARLADFEERRCELQPFLPSLLPSLFSPNRTKTAS